MKGFGNLSSLILSFSNVKYHLEKTNNYVAVAINELGLRGGEDKYPTTGRYFAINQNFKTSIEKSSVHYILVISG